MSAEKRTASLVTKRSPDAHTLSLIAMLQRLTPSERIAQNDRTITLIYELRRGFAKQER